MPFYKILVLSLATILLWSQPGFAQVSCEVAVSQAKELAAKEKLNEVNTQKLLAMVEKDPDLIRYLNDDNFLAYVKGVAQGKSVNELAPYLFEMWKNEGLNDVNLNKKGVPDLAKVFSESNAFKNDPDLTKRHKKERLALQLKALPATLKRLKNLIETEMHPSVLDANLWAFKGYLDYKIADAGLRPWNAVSGSFGSIKLNQVSAIDPTTMIKVSMLANAIEIPIDKYSDNSGETLRVVSPQATRFMGKNTEQATAHQKIIDAARAAGKNEIFCVNSWCREENRHAGVLANSATGIGGYKPKEDTQFSSYPGLDALNVQDAFFHLFSRNDTEWHAGSAYFLLGGHASGALGTWIGNIRHDELKHQSIFGGLYKYLLGDTYNTRLKEMMKKALTELREKGKDESLYGDIFSTEPVTAIETLYIHVKYEQAIRRFFQSVGLKTLRKVYETDINLKELPADPMSPEKERAINELSAKETEIRKALGRWPKAQREAYLRLEAFEKRMNWNLTEMIKVKFNLFKGAEDYGSVESVRVNRVIDQLSQKDWSDFGFGQLNKEQVQLAQQSLKETLRDYQIMNNRMVRSLGLNVTFLDATKGFELAKDAQYDAVKKLD